VALGTVENLRRAAEMVREPVAVLTPLESNRGAYGDAYVRYRQLFESLRPMFEPPRPALSLQARNRFTREARIH
jgi:hypothetical protein